MWYMWRIEDVDVGAIQDTMNDDPGIFSTVAGKG